MGTDKRARQKANRAAKLEKKAKAETRDNLIGRVVTIGGIGLLALAAMYFLTRGGGDDSETADTTVATTEVTADSTTAPPAEVAVGECPAPDGSSAQTLSFDAPPPMCIDPTKTYTAQMTTSYGPITIQLDATKAPATVNNFVVLSRYHYYDGATFHRVIEDFMIQGGDPVGDPAGIGDPGYKFNDELPADGDYQIGSIAMANSGPDTQGSQFFIVTGANGVGLPPLYSLFGQVTDGMETVTAIETTETGESDAPLDPVVIESVTITES